MAKGGVPAVSQAASLAYEPCPFAEAGSLERRFLTRRWTPAMVTKPLGPPALAHRQGGGWIHRWGGGRL